MNKIIFKYLLVSVFLIFQGINTNAQTDSLKRSETEPAQQIPHLTFKKTQINGPVKSFIKKLELTGMKQTAANRVKGPFATFEVNAVMGLTLLTNSVYCVDVYFPTNTAWNTSYDTFVMLREKLTELYGKPEKSIDKFDHPYTRDDGYTIRAFKENKAHFECLWVLENGTISLCIIPASVPKSEGRTQVIMNYTDEQGLELQMKEKDMIIKNDL